VVGHEYVCLLNVKNGNRPQNEETLTPLRSPCVRPVLWRYFKPSAAPCNYCRI
jgi:hypothetical protein